MAGWRCQSLPAIGFFAVFGMGDDKGLSEGKTGMKLGLAASFVIAAGSTAGLDFSDEGIHGGEISESPG